MKNINLYFDMEFSSLSPDAQPIILGIVSDEIPNAALNYKLENDIHYVFDGEFNSSRLAFSKKSKEDACNIWIEKFGSHSKSFYAEFSDFDLNRCDDWVKENVVKKLLTNQLAEKLGMSFENAKDAAKTSTNWSREYCILKSTDSEISLVGNTWRIKDELKNWIAQFSDYQIQFVCDCGCFDWYWMLQLLAEWDEKDNYFEYDPMKNIGAIEIPKGFNPLKSKVKTGFPKLQPNISPVPQDLNDLIALKKSISVREAFELNREELFGSWDKLEEIGQTRKVYNTDQFPKHNALFDAKVIKAIYNKLK